MQRNGFYATAVNSFRQRLLAEVLERCEGDRTLTAKMLGVSRSTVKYLLAAQRRGKKKKGKGGKAPAWQDRLVKDLTSAVLREFRVPR